MKNWSLVFILAAGLLCLSACRTQAETSASSGTNVENQAVEQTEDTSDAEDLKKDTAEAMEDIQEAQREAREEAEEARREALEEAREAQKEAMEDAREAQKDIQEGLKEAQKGLLEAQKELRNAGINIALPRITGASFGMSASASSAEKAGAVLIVPDKPANAKTMGELTEDMQVMAVVFEDKLGQNKTAGAQGYGAGGYGGGVWLNIFGSSSPQPRTVYLGGYGMMFTMDVDFPLVLIKGAEEKQPEATQEKKDEVWQRGKDKLKGKDKEKMKDKDKEPALVFDVEKVKQLQKDLTAALKHASNIRNLEPREKIIVVVRSIVNGECLSLVVPETTGVQEKEPVSIPTSVMTLQVEKQNIDAFAAEKISFDKFAEKVSVVIY